MTNISQHNCRRALFTALLVLGLVFAFAAPDILSIEPLLAQEATQGREAGAVEAEHDSGWGSTIAKAANFAALAGLLAYFLKGPFVGYLRSRSETIRKDLVEAAALRTAAEQQLAGVRTRLSTLPEELEALRRRGQDELAGERTRLASATAQEKDRVLERTRREIDLHVRVARRALVEHTAAAAMNLARRRIERDITPDDQVRLIDRYSAEVRP